ncbi:MAG: carbonic anhydrase [Prevotella sp.]|nr:carbonic anhydrase [Prevotella sp.]
MIDDILKFNKEFVNNKGYEPYLTTKYPDKKLAIVACMDTRLTELIYAALGLKNGDVKMIKNAGGLVSSPFDSTIRSLLVGVYELGVENVMILGHTDCGAQHLDPQEMISLMLEKGISQDHIDMMKYCGIDFESWLNGFESSEQAVAASVDLVRHHPLMPSYINVRGFVINSVTGELVEVEVK